MDKTDDLIIRDIFFEVIDIFGKKIRTTKSYWEKIKTVKHKELKYGSSDIKKALVKPDEVRRSVTDATIFLYAKKIKKYDILIVAVKVLNGEGFLVTAYQIKVYRRKGELLWPNQNEK